MKQSDMNNSVLILKAKALGRKVPRRFFTMASLLITLALLLPFLIVGCGGSSSSDDKSGEGGSAESESVDNYIADLPELEQVEETTEFEKTSEEEKEIDGYACYLETYKGAPGFSSFMFSKSNVDVLYPGVLLNGQSLSDGSYIPSTIQTGSLTITVNLQSIDGDISSTIDEPSYSSVQSAIHQILSQNISGDAGAEMSWSVETIYSDAHLKASLGINVGVADIFGISGNAGIDFSANYKRTIIQYTQKYYDVVIDIPHTPSDYLDPSVSLDEVKEVFQETSPAYISSVAYGRYVLFYFESSDLSMDIEAAINASITVPVEGVPVELGGEGALDAGFAAGTLTCKAYILGGSGEQASMAINSLDALLEFVKTGGKYSADSPGKPISYTMRYLSNNKPVKIISATEYEKTQCSKIFNKYRITAKSFSIVKNNGAAAVDQIDLYGNLTVTPESDDTTPEGGGTLWTATQIASYPIVVGNEKLLSGEVELDFGDLGSDQRGESSILIGTPIDAEWGLVFTEQFSPREKRIYLNDLAEGELTLEIATVPHTLQITLDVLGLE